jgi:hypothetical protein
VLRSRVPSPLTSTPACSMCTSSTRSNTVWRNPSRFETIDVRALTPSVEAMVPSPFWSKPRPPAGNVTATPPGGVTVYVLAEPNPWPTTLIAIVAMPACASEAATTHGAPFIESVNPWPKTATGQPPAGVGPDGTKSVNSRSLTPCRAGTPVSVPTGGIVCDVFS